jgi:hypothetical protein
LCNRFFMLKTNVQFYSLSTVSEITLIKVYTINCTCLNFHFIFISCS